ARRRCCRVKMRTLRKASRPMFCRSLRRRLPVAAAALFLATPGLAPVQAVRADPTADTARSLLEKYKDAVVTFNVVIKVSGGPLGEEQNTELEAQGFVLDATGLIVTTNAAIDPVSMFANFPGAQDELSKVTTKVVSVRILRPNGDEIPAKVV